MSRSASRPPTESASFTVDPDAAAAVLAVLRRYLPGTSWSTLRQLLQARRIAINGALCLDEGRRVTPGEVVSIVPRPLPAPPTDRDVVIHWLDAAVVVVEKPAGMITLRHTAEQHWSQARRDLHPTLDECVQRLLRDRYVRSRSAASETLFPVHRIDRDTSGLLVFARQQSVQEQLIQQFAAHTALRAYRCLIPGSLPDQTIRTLFVRDRGDGRRGSIGQPSGSDPGDEDSVDETSQRSVEAITHIHTLQRYLQPAAAAATDSREASYSELQCRLETGRTNQIRIHLAELGHPVCGDIKYRGPLHAPPLPDHSGVPRLALHAAELGFVHPVSGELLRLETPWPTDIRNFLQRLLPVARPADESTLPTVSESHPA